MKASSYIPCVFSLCVLAFCVSQKQWGCAALNAGIALLTMLDGLCHAIRNRAP